ncbi:MAG: hypothetical protein CMD25_02045 [Flavobacteriales bacterium]|nr:hypothetical protein [Flavobacteriales bacterium]|tara:strand:+ start:124 stop:315 length:192 start_codon:yes stop_codon:yes gene_type:complete
MDIDKYIRRKANASGLTPLRYYRAFTDGVEGCKAYIDVTCEKTLAAYKDGRRYKKRFDSKTSS